MEQAPTKQFQPYIADENTSVAELTVKSILLGALFGVLFGAATVYLALKAGLTVSASIPIAVLAISIGRKLIKTTILENNIIQTAGSAGESIAAGVAFTLPGFLFLSPGANGAEYFRYTTIFFLAMLGGILGTLMMIPLRRSLIVKEHGTLPYPEGTACASVLIAGERGGQFARTAYLGLAAAGVYATLQKIFAVIAETPTWFASRTNKYLPSASVAGEITPEYLGVGYIIGPRICGVLVAGGVFAWLALIPLLAFFVPGEVIATQLQKLGYAPARYGWDATTQTFAETHRAIYFAFVRQIGAGAVAAGGFITLLKTLPTIVSSLRDSIASMKDRSAGKSVARTANDLSITTVIGGSLGLIVIVALLPMVPGNSFLTKLFLGLLIVVFGFLFVTVASRIVGLIGSSNSPISGMTIATLMGTCLVFAAIGWSGSAYEPMVLVVGGMVCIAAANAGATSQDLKTGYIVGATPRSQQIALFVGAICSAVVIGVTVQILNTPTQGTDPSIQNMIGTERFPAPQATLMATLIRGLLSFNLDWVYVAVGACVAVTMELCGVKSLSFAVGSYLPLSTTLPIWVGGAIKGLVGWVGKRKGETVEDGELTSGDLFATGLVAGGALLGVVIAALQVPDATNKLLKQISFEASLTNMLGHGGYMALGTLFFLGLAALLYVIARRPLGAKLD
jgi:putative OPT family oligopeptide transporter